ncbi:MAG: hypothetical protein AB9869_35185 [Verrucomicrobiia bacterium]
MKFEKGNVIVPVESTYPTGALVVFGYEPDGTLLAYPQGGGLRYRFKPGSERQFRLVGQDEMEKPLWRRARFEIEGVEKTFEGWTDGTLWNGWAKPYFEFGEAEKLMTALNDPMCSYDAAQDRFVTKSSSGEDESWTAEVIAGLGGTRLKVYGIGAGAWVWDEEKDG